MMAQHRPPAEEEYFRNMFDLADESGIGQLGKREILGLMRELGRELDERELKTAMALMDEDGDGSVSWEEFDKWFGYLTEQDLSAQRIFDAVDCDGSGRAALIRNSPYLLGIE
jgi:Ca2+-binding EF-hand superfamily protein